jgi:hypothetical protein
MSGRGRQDAAETDSPRGSSGRSSPTSQLGEALQQGGAAVSAAANTAATKTREFVEHPDTQAALQTARENAHVAGAAVAAAAGSAMQQTRQAVQNIDVNQFSEDASGTITHTLDASQQMLDDLGADADAIVHQARVQNIIFLGTVFLLGIFLAYFGHKLKKGVLFTTGVLPVLFLHFLFIESRLVGAGSTWLFAVPILVGVAAVGLGIFMLKYPKCGLGGLGALAGAILGKFLNDILAQSITPPQEVDKKLFYQVLLCSCIIGCASIAAWLMVACFKNAYCLVIPFVGAICVSDSLATFTVRAINKWSDNESLIKLFPMDTKFICNMWYQKGNKSSTMHGAVTTVNDGINDAVHSGKDLVNGAGMALQGLVGGGVEGENPAADEWHYIQNHWAPYLLSLTVFLIVYISGMSLHCKEFKKEQDENRKNLAKAQEGDTDSEESEQLLRDGRKPEAESAMV